MLTPPQGLSRFREGERLPSRDGVCLAASRAAGITQVISALRSSGSDGAALCWVGFRCSGFS